MCYKSTSYNARYEKWKYPYLVHNRMKINY